MTPIKVVERIVSRLSGQQWMMRRGDGNDGWPSQQDLVATAPNGKIYLIEVREGEDPTHFAAIAQLERSARLLGEQERKKIVPILLTSQIVGERISKIANNLGVRILEVIGSDQEAADSLIDFLQKEIRR